MTLPRSTILLIAFFFLLNLFLKTFLITSTPPLLTHDEIYYATESRSLLIDGSDLKGNWHPWQFEPANSIYSELTGLVSLPGHLLFPHQPIFATKFIPIILGSLIPVLLGLIGLSLFSLKKSASITQTNLIFATTTIIATLNPWVFQFSRMSFDSIFSSGLILLGVTFILYFHSFHKLWSLIPLFLGFFQYQGHKPLLFPLVMITLIFTLNLSNLKFSPKKAFYQYFPHLLIAFFCLSLTLIYLYRLPHLSSANRGQEISVFNTTAISSEVNELRRLSLDTPLTPIFNNKLILIFRQIMNRLFDSLEPSRLFLHGDANLDSFSLTNYGFFHPFDLFLIILGIFFLCQNHTPLKSRFFIIFFILIGTLPNLIKTQNIWITFRGAFTFMGLIILTGLGLYYLITKIKNPKLIPPVFITYLITSLPFLYSYFFQYPLTSTQNQYFYHRVISNLVLRQPETSFLIYADDPQSLYDSLLVYNQLINQDNLQVIRANLTQTNLSLQNFTIINHCLDESAFTDINKTILVDYRIPLCEKTNPALIPQPSYFLSSPINSGAMYAVYQNKYCSKIVPRYIYIKTNVFHLESLPQSTFCSSFFNHPHTPSQNSNE